MRVSVINKFQRPAENALSTVCLAFMQLFNLMGNDLFRNEKPEFENVPDLFLHTWKYFERSASVKHFFIGDFLTF